MNYKIDTIAILCLGFCSYLNAQTEITGNEKYNSFKECKLINNLNQKIIPKLLMDLYYLNLKQSDLKITYQEINESSKKRNIYFETKKAKKGFL